MLKQDHRQMTLQPNTVNSSNTLPMLGIHKLGLLLIVATSSVVFIEPAPYDVLALGLGLFFFIIGLKPPKGISTPFLLLILMYAGFAISSAFGDYHELAYKALGVRFYMILSWVFFASMVYKHPRQTMNIIWHAYIFAGLIAVTWGFMEYFGYIPMEEWEGGQRAKGPFKDPNVYGPFLVPVAIFTLYKSISGKYMLFYLPFALLFMMGILLSFSRGAWINTAMSLLVFGLVMMFSKHSKQKATSTFLMATVGAMIVFAGLAFIAQNEQVADRFSERTSISQSYDLKEGGRFDTQKKAIVANLANPIGYGAGAAAEVFGIPPHNIYLHILTEGGWIGFIGFVSFAIITLIKALNTLSIKSPHRDNLVIILACVFGVLFQSFFIDSTHWRHMYMIFGLLWGLLLAVRHGKTRKSVSANINI